MLPMAMSPSQNSSFPVFMTHHKRTREDGFVVSQVALGEPLQFDPALGSVELDNLINAYIPGPEPVSQKRARVTIDFLNTVDASSIHGLPGPVSRLYHVPSPLRAAGQPMQSSPTSSSSSTSAKRPRSESTNNPVKRHPGFSIMTKDGVDITEYASRGPKTKEQRDHAALMRKIGSCAACKRKKQKCDPTHHKPITSNAQASTSKSDPSSSSSRPSISPPTTMDETFSPLVSKASSSRLIAYTGERFSPLTTPKPVLSPFDFVECTSLDNLGMSPSDLIDPQLVATWDATFPGLDYPLYPEADPWDATLFQSGHVVGPDVFKQNNIADAALAAAESGMKQSAQSTSDPPSDSDWFDFHTFADKSRSNECGESNESDNTQHYRDYQWSNMNVAPDLNTAVPSYVPRMRSGCENISASKSLADLPDALEPPSGVVVLGVTGAGKSSFIQQLQRYSTRVDQPVNSNGSPLFIQSPKSAHLNQGQKGGVYLNSAPGSLYVIDTPGFDDPDQSEVICSSRTHVTVLPRLHKPEIVKWHDQGHNLPTLSPAYHETTHLQSSYESKRAILAEKLLERWKNCQAEEERPCSSTSSTVAKSSVEGCTTRPKIASATTLATIPLQTLCSGNEKILNTSEKRDVALLSNHSPSGGISIGGGDVVRCANLCYDTYQQIKIHGDIFVNLSAEIGAVRHGLQELECLVRIMGIYPIIHSINNDLERLRDLRGDVSKGNIMPLSVKAELFHSKFLIHNHKLRLVLESIKLSSHFDRGIFDLNYPREPAIWEQRLDAGRQPQWQEWPTPSCLVSGSDTKSIKFWAYPAKSAMQIEWRSEAFGMDVETETNRTNYEQKQTKAGAKTKFLNLLLLTVTLIFVMLLSRMRASSLPISISGNSLFPTRSYSRSVARASSLPSSRCTTSDQGDGEIRLTHYGSVSDSQIQLRTASAGENVFIAVAEAATSIRTSSQ